MSVPPVITVHLARDGRTVHFYCQHCCQKHVHGADGIVDGTNTHRSAHCFRDNSPYRDKGYILQLMVQPPHG